MSESSWRNASGGGGGAGKQRTGKSRRRHHKPVSAGGPRVLYSESEAEDDGGARVAKEKLVASAIIREEDDEASEALAGAAAAGGGGGATIRKKRKEVSMPPPARPTERCFAMIDGEFLGPHYADPVLAFSVVLFRRPPTQVLNINQYVIDKKTVRVRLSSDWESIGDPETVKWLQGQKKLLRWLSTAEKDEKDIFDTEKEAAIEFAAFLDNALRKYRIQFFSKPACVDLGRVSHWMTRFLGRKSPCLGYDGLCLLTRLRDARTHTGLRAHEINDMIMHEQMRLHATPNHLPEQDCLGQIVASEVCLRLSQWCRKYSNNMMQLRQYLATYKGGILNAPPPVFLAHSTPTSHHHHHHSGASTYPAAAMAAGWTQYLQSMGGSGSVG